MSREFMRDLLIKLADALYDFDDSNTLLREIDDALDELKKPVPEPVAWLTIDSINNHHVHLVKMTEKTIAEWNIKQQLPLYTNPPAQQKPLSDDEITKYFFHPIPNLGTAIAFARAIEAAHGIK